MRMRDEAAEKIERRETVVGVIGLGYVGLPLCRAFTQAGFPVLGFDVDPAKIEQLSAGVNYLTHLGEGFVRDITAGGRFESTADFSRLGEADAVLICVPTPLGDHREPDLTYVEHSTRQVAETLRPGQLVVLESTTYPQTTRGLMLPILEENGLRCGEDFFLAYSPEREDPGRKDFDTQTIPKLVGGIDEVSGDLAFQLYAAACTEVIRVAGAEVAEAAKLLENIYRSVNIAMINEMKVLMTEMGIDVWQVIDAAKTKPFGFQPFYPGPGLGGHCIPIDPYYLTWKAREVGLPTRFIELAGEINHAMPGYVVDRTMWALNQQGKALKGARLLVLGLAYKPDVGDVRESPSLELIVRFRELGADVRYNDPHVPATHRMRKYDLDMESVPLSPECLAACDVVVVATNHAAYNWEEIAEHARLIVDTRGALRAVANPRATVVGA